LLTSGSGSQSSANPGAATVGSISSTASVTLTQGSQYTEDRKYTLTAGGLQIDSNLYSGATATGSAISTLSATAASPLTTSFDALGIGWRSTAASTGGTVIDLNAIQVTSNVGGIVPEPATIGLIGVAGLM